MDEPVGVLVLPSTQRAPALAREHTRRIGSAWSSDLLDVVLLVVSEAVTNAVQYGRGGVELAIDVRRDRIRIEVTDGNPDPPVRGGSPDGLADGGRGLYLLDALTAAWGTQPRSGGPGKTVWLELTSQR
jgi:anti-sigma regulatory factor (Ser/Thr protein kinase)